MNIEKEKTETGVKGTETYLKACEEAPHLFYST